ncbi:hypothetical protein EON65_04225 [archaeon]|nr:MAG: hypothetical protein EON65_04225 [archaeon]
MDYWAEYHDMKRQAVHDQFRYSTSDNPYAVSFDATKFFATHADVNRYAHFLRVCILHICKYLCRKRDAMLKRSITLWKKAIYDYTEEDMQNNHIEGLLVKHDFEQEAWQSYQQAQAEIVDTFASLSPVMRSHFTGQHQSPSSFLSPTKSTLFDPLNHGRISALPLRNPELSPYFKADVMTVPPFFPNQDGQIVKLSDGNLTSIQKDLWEDIPAYDPSAKMSEILPSLLPIQPPKSFKDRLYYHITLQKNASTASPLMRGRVDTSNVGDVWRASMQGPTSDSYWLIPNILCVGQAPFGVAERTDLLVVSNCLRKEDGTGQIKEDEEETEDGPGGLDMLAKSYVRPTGPPKKKKEKIALTAISALLLQGADCFLSLLTEEEEAHLEAVYGTPPIQQQIENALVMTKSNANDVICYNQDAIIKQENIMEEIPNYGRTDPRYPAAYRQRLRCEARIELAKSNIQRIKSQIIKLPEKIIWKRLDYLAKKKNDKWTIDDVLPSLWHIEEFVRAKKSIYMYSYNIHINNTHIQSNIARLTDQQVYYPLNSSVHNHDRIAIDDSAGLLGAMLVGRVYHLEPYEVMFRWQSSHDTMKSLTLLPIAKEYNTYYHISCPCLPWKKNLLVEVIKHTHYALQYPIIRAQENPERFEDFFRDEYDLSLKNQVIAKFSTKEAEGVDRQYERAESDRQEEIYEKGLSKRLKQSLYFK